MTLHLAFYKAKGTWLNRAVRMVTGSPYSHVELVFGEGEAPPCFSSDSRALGLVRFRKMDLPGDVWDLVEFKVTGEQYIKMMEFAVLEVDRPYDVLGVLRFVVPWIPAAKGAWFCSALVTATMQAGGRFPWVDPSRVSPGGLYELVMKEAQDA